MAVLFLVVLFFLSNYGEADQLDDIKGQMLKIQSHLNDMDNEIKLLKANQATNVCPDGWTQYKDTKCFKVLDTKTSELSAKQLCNQLESSSTLITITTEDEQNFVNPLIEKYNNITTNAWIGLEFYDKIFHWMDGNELKYENWDENAEKVGKCVQISLSKSNLGKWLDDDCAKKYLVACQKKQNTMTILEDEIQNLTKVIGIQQDRIASSEKKIQDQFGKHQDEINSLIPIGLLYTQFPNKTSPQQLWSQYKWQDVTNEYAGLFFRAEGKGSATFGNVQEQQGRSISLLAHHEGPQDNFVWIDNEIKINDDKMVKYIITGGWTGENTGLRIRLVNEEIRPRNQAIRIWQRIN